MKGLGAVGVVAVLAGSAVARADVMMFENFESGLGNWTATAWISDAQGQPTGQAPAANLYGYGIVNKGAGVPDAAIAEGNSALKLWADQSATRLTLLSGFSTGPIVAGKAYRFGLNFNQSSNASSAPEGRLFVDVLWYDSADQLIQTSRFSDGEVLLTPGRTFVSGNANTTGDFGNLVSVEGAVHADLVAPANAAKFRISIRAGGWVKSADPYYIDAISVSDVGAVPEPASAGIMGMGAAAVVLSRKRFMRG